MESFYLKLIFEWEFRLDMQKNTPVVTNIVVWSYTLFVLTQGPMQPNRFNKVFKSLLIFIITFCFEDTTKIGHCWKHTHQNKMEVPKPLFEQKPNKTHFIFKIKLRIHYYLSKNPEQWWRCPAYATERWA